METIVNIKNQNYIFNHIIYNSSTDKEFAKHAHSLYELIYILEGEVDYIIEDRFYRAKKGDLIFIRPHQYHCFTIISKESYNKLGILFQPSFISVDPSIINNKIELIDCKKNPIIGSLFDKLNYYYQVFSKSIFLDLLFSATKEIILNLSLIQEGNIPAQYASPIISSVIHYINENLTSINTLEDISSALNISVSYLKKIFKEQLKTQPKHYINEKKLLMAHDLISSGKKIAIVSDLCGFQNYSTFYRLYCKYFGNPPSKSTTSPTKKHLIQTT